MSDGDVLTKASILIVLAAVVFLPTIVAFWSGNRYRWFIFIANLFIPAKPPAWLALLLGTMFTGHRQYRRRRR